MGGGRRRWKREVEGWGGGGKQRWYKTKRIDWNKVSDLTEFGKLWLSWLTTCNIGNISQTTSDSCSCKKINGKVCVYFNNYYGRTSTYSINIVNRNNVKGSPHLAVFLKWINTVLECGKEVWAYTYSINTLPCKSGVRGGRVNPLAHILVGLAFTNFLPKNINSAQELAQPFSHTSFYL